MAKFMTTVDMDDVLNSIRRLVSDDDAKKSHAGAAADSRLLLTPAQRVQPPADADEPEIVFASKSASAEPRPAAGNDAPELAAMEQAWQAELARMKARREHEAQSKTGHDTAHELSRPPAPEQAAQTPPHEPAPSEPRRVSDMPPRISLEDRIAELEAAVSRVGDEWEPDGTEPDVAQPPRHHIFEVIDNTRQERTGPADEEAAGDKPVFSHADKPLVLGLAETEADDAQEITQEPAAQKEKPYAPPARIVEDDDVYLDVDALRDMIADVVREELRGRMGETITRNVRKMVRQELERALLRFDPD